MRHWITYAARRGPLRGIRYGGPTCRLTARVRISELPDNAPGLPALAVLLLFLIGILCATASAQAQQAGDDIGTSGPRVTLDEGGVRPVNPDGDDTAAAVEIRAALSREIARMKDDIATMKRFTARSEDLLRIARTDPAEALRQRLPMAECRVSALAPLCDHMTALFKPEERANPAQATDTGDTQ